MKANILTAVVSLLGSMVVGAAVATAMNHNRDSYLRFVGFVAVVAIVTVVAKAYRTYVARKDVPVVEETPASEGGATR